MAFFKSPAFLRNVLANAVGNFVRQAATAAQEFGARALLSPAVFGAWELAGLIRRIGNILDPGFLSAAQRDLPVLRGAGKRNEESDYRATTFFTHLSSRTLVATGVLGYGLCFWHRFTGIERMAFLAAALMLVIFGITESLAMFYQSAEQYYTLTRATVLASVIGALAALAATMLWGFRGFLAANIAGLALQAALLARPLGGSGLPIRPVWRGHLFRRQAGLALPLKAADYPLGLLGEIDLLVVSKFAGLGPLAVYGVAKALFNQAVQITSWLAQVLIVRINHQGSSDAKRGRLGEEIGRYLSVLDLILLPVLICCCYVIALPFICRFLPAYAGGLDLLRTLLLTAYFVPQTTVVRNLWILDKKIRLLALSNLAGLLAAIVGIGVGAWWSGFSLETVAKGYLFGHALYYLLIMSSVGRQALGNGAALAVASQAVFSCGYVAVILKLLPERPASLYGLKMLVEVAGNIGVVALLLVPLVTYGARKTKLLAYTISLRRSTAAA